jgi:hypothetical protein
MLSVWEELFTPEKFMATFDPGMWQGTKVSVSILSAQIKA